MTIYKPYTYLIGWTSHSMWYYGVRYAKTADPNELWKKYFTSSKHVKAFAQKYGDPDVIQIRKIFNTANSACNWENKVLKRIKAKSRRDFLNATDNRAIPSTPFDRTKNLGHYVESGPRGSWEELYGNDRAEKMRKNLSATKKGKSCGKGIPKSDGQKQKMSKAAFKRWKDPLYRKVNSHKWIYHPVLGGIKKVQAELVDGYILEGWARGRKGFTSH